MLTEAQFKASGMSDLTTLTEEVISQLESDNIQILVLTKNPSIDTFSLETTAIPKRQVVVQETEMVLPAPIKSFTLTGSVSSTSVLKVITSIDNGITWRAYDGSNWIVVDINDLDDVASKGMTVAAFNGITEAVWKQELANLKVRFAYYLDLSSVTDEATLDKLTYETVPVVDKSPKLNSIKIAYDDLTIEGRLKDLERINAINLAKLNFKSNALLLSEKYEMHDMIVDTCDTEEMVTTFSSGAGEKRVLSQAFSNEQVVGEGKVSELSLTSYRNLKKVEVK